MSSEVASNYLIMDDLVAAVLCPDRFPIHRHGKWPKIYNDTVATGAYLVEEDTPGGRF